MVFVRVVFFEMVKIFTEKESGSGEKVIFVKKK